MPLESSLLLLLDFSQQLMLVLFQTISLINIYFEWIHFGKTETHIRWSPFQSGTRLFSWSGCWWHYSFLLMDQGRSCTKNISVSNYCAIDVSTTLPHNTFILLLQRWLAKQLFQCLCFVFWMFCQRQEAISQGLIVLEALIGCACRALAQSH